MSIIRTNQITDTSGNGTPSFPNGIPAGTSGVGKILNIESTHVQQFASGITSTSYSDIPEATLSITPSSTTSKIFLLLNFGIGRSGINSDWFKVIRTIGGVSTTVAPSGTSEGESWGGGSRGTNPTYELRLVNWTFLDSPNTTSLVTYKLQARVDGGTLYLNRVGANTTRASTFNWTAMEKSA